MSELSFNAIIKANLKAAGVRRFVKMRARKADKVFWGLKRSLPFCGTESFIVSDLETRGYYKAKKFLNETLPKLTIGYTFDTRECRLLHSMDREKAAALFEEFGADRAKSMWHAYYRYNSDGAIDFLGTLAGTDRRTFRHALTGMEWLIKEDAPMISNILDYSRKYGSSLPASLVKLGDLVIMKAVKELGLEDLSGFFIKPYLFQIKLPEDDEAVVRSVVRSLGVEKAFSFYKYLVENDAMAASEAVDEICLDEKALKKVIERNDAYQIGRTLEEHIINYICS